MNDEEGPIDPVSPLLAIHQKELELRQRVAQARQQTEARLQAAHQEAVQIMAQAEREGREEAEILYQRELEKAHQEAALIIAAAHARAAALRRQAATKLEGAVEQVMKLVLAMDSWPD